MPPTTYSAAATVSDGSMSVFDFDRTEARRETLKEFPLAMERLSCQQQCVFFDHTGLTCL